LLLNESDKGAGATVELKKMEPSATAKIAELLRHQDDLDKVSEIKQKLARENAVVDGQLKAGVQAQIAVLTKGCERLTEARGRIDNVRDDIMKIQRLRIDSKDSVENFDKINRVSRTLQSFENTERFLDNFKTMSDELNQIQFLILEDGNFGIESSMPNLLTVHYLLSILRDVEDEAWFHAQTCTEDIRRTIAKHFSPLDKTVEKFDHIIFAVAECLLEIMRTGDPSLVVRVAAIVDYEEKQDLVADISNEIQNSSQDNVLRSLNKIFRVRRDYPARFFRAIEESIAATFDNCMEEYSPKDTPVELLQNLGWIFSDLITAKENLVHCMPERWNIFDKFVQYYHSQAYHCLAKIMEYEPTASSILHILDYVKEYYQTMEKELGVGLEKLVPPLLDGKEDSLYDDYLALLVSKLREWYNNIVRTEKEPFILRQSAPETSNEGLYGMEGEADMFKLVTQQIEVAASSGQGRILAGCIEECAKILRERQKDWTRVLKTEVQKELNDITEEGEESSIPPGLFGYIIALANDQMRAVDYTESISSKRAESVSKKYKARITSSLDEVVSGFIDMVKLCIQGMLDLIFNDIRVPFREIFRSSDWYKGRPMNQIIDTIAEYASDCQQYQIPVVFDVFMQDLLEDTLLAYLGALNNGIEVLKPPKATDRIKKDVELMYGLFSDPQYGMEPETIQERFKIIEHLLATLQSPIDELPIRFQELRQDFWDAPLDLFEKVLRIRKGMDVKAVAGTMVKVRNEALQSQPSESHESTFLARYRSKR
jgi:exocyst complex component 3